MKKIYLKLMALALMSVLSVSQMRAYELNCPTLYFDDMSSTTSPTTWTKAQFFYFIDYNGSGRGSEGVAMERITNTNLFYVIVGKNRGNDMSGFSYGFIESDAWPWEAGDNWTNRWSNRTWTEHHSSSSQTNLPYGAYLCTSTGSDNLTVTNLNSTDDGSTNLKYDQTVNVVLNGATPSTSPAAITLTSGYWTDKKSVTLSPTSKITKGGSTKSDTYSNAAYTATTTLEVGTPTSGIYFVGWYNGDTEKSTNTTWTYYPREANTITARFENRYTIGVSADENGSITTGGSSVTAGYYTNPTISASANSHYIFDHWKVTGGASVADQYNSTTTVSASAAGTVEAIFAPVWAIMGGNNELKDGSDKMGDWQIYNGLKFTGTDWVYSGTIYLDANTTYQFKVVDRPSSDTYYGYGGSKNFRIGFVGQSGASLGLGTGSSNSENLRIMTAAAGYYTFTWNSKSDTRTLTVEYPEETHPSSNYVYFKKPDAWSEVYVHIFTNTEDAQTGWERLPLIDYFTFDGTNYYYAALGSETKCLFASTSDQPTTKTADLTTASSNKGKYYDNSTTSWKNFTATLTLDHQSPSNTPAPNTITVTYGASTNLTGDVITTSPAKGGYYTFGGYYTEEGGEGDQFIAANETVNTNVPDYTDESKNWIKTGSSVSTRIYAKWTQDVTLHDNNGGSHNGSTTATWNAAGPFSISAPTKTGYSVEGYYAEAGMTNKVLTNTGAIAATTVVDGSSVTFISGSKWKHEAATTLYTKWTEDKHSVTIEAGDNGSVDPTSVSGVGITTASSTITATADDGYDFSSWTLPIDGSVTIASGSGTRIITINATADGKTITANFTAHTYGITLNAGDHGAGAGSASVVFNTSALATVSHVSANAGYSLDGYYDGELKVLNANGSFAADNVTGYITSGKWSKTSNATLTAKFSTVKLYFRAKSTSYWKTPGNWEPACVPTIDHEVVIEKPVTIDVNTAQAKSVKIIRYGEDYTGKLNIDDEGGLVVAQDILAKHASDGDYEATTKEDLQIRTGYYGNGGLITGQECVGNNAEYVFYTKAYKYGSWYINQYVGIPFTSMDANQLYGFNIFVYDPSVDDWRTPASSTMDPWTTYNLIRKYSSSDWSTFYLDGELNLPGLEGEQEFACGSRVASGGKTDDPNNEYFNSGGDYMFANSWTAPIDIASISTTDMPSASFVRTIYIFNAGYVDKESSQKAVGDLAGQWSSFPIASSAYMDDAVIPATQAFLVSAKEEDAKMTLNYEDHVYNPAITASEINTYPTRAPRRAKTEDTPNVLKMIVRSESDIADQLYILERSDFSFGYDDSWDGNKIFGLTSAPQIYAVNGVNKMAVNAIPDMEGMKIGFKAGKDVNEYTFSFEYEDDAETLYLYDTDTQVYTQITSEATYSFTTSDTKEHERFVITRKAPQIVTGFEEVEGENVKRAEKFIQDNMIFIRRGDRIYTATGNVVK